MQHPLFESYGVLLGLFMLSAWLFFGGLRWMIKELFRALILLELAMLRLMQWLWRPRYELRGACQLRGACCTMIVGDPPSIVKNTRWLLLLYTGFHKVFHNFSVNGRGEQGEIIFKCHHLQSDGRCGIYRYRPLLCRNYPIIPWVGYPRPLPGCGYQVVHRSAAKLQNNPKLPILNAQVAVHHPTRLMGRERFEQIDDFHLVDLGPQ